MSDRPKYRHGVRTPFEHIRVENCNDCPCRDEGSCYSYCNLAQEGLDAEVDEGGNPPKDCPLRHRARIVYIDPPDWDDHPDERFVDGKWEPRMRF